MRRKATKTTSTLRPISDAMIDLAERINSSRNGNSSIYDGDSESTVHSESKSNILSSTSENASPVPVYDEEAVNFPFEIVSQPINVPTIPDPLAEESQSNRNKSSLIGRWSKSTLPKTPKGTAWQIECTNDSVATLKTTYLMRELEMMEEKHKIEIEERRNQMKREADEHALKMKIWSLQYERMRKNHDKESIPTLEIGEK